MKILLVEDDDAFIKVLTRALKGHHYSVDSVKDGEAGWTYGSTFDYDLMVMDIVLPKLDGISLCKRFRAEGYATPILLLTAQDSNTAKVQGLDAGADDYVVKPFDQAELLARIRALLRRSSSNPMPLLTWGDLLLNPSTCEVQYKGQNLALTGKEYELLELMLRDSQHVFCVDELLEHLWSSEDFPSEATVRSHIRRVRQKLVASGAPHDFIATLHGRGYYLKPPESSESSVSDGWVRAGTSAGMGMGKAGFSEASATQPAVSDLSNAAALDPSLAAQNQAQYLAFLNQTWKTTQPNSLEQVTELLQAIATLQTNALTPDQQTHAQQVAHKLAGTLSLFGLQKAVHLARQLEHWLGSQDALPANQVELMHPLVQELQHELQITTDIQPEQIPQGVSPQLLLIGADQEFEQALRAIATHRGVAVNPIPFQEVESASSPADVILLHFPGANAGHAATPHLSLAQSLQRLAQQYPEVPLLVVSDRLGLCDRLEVVRQGGRFLLDLATPPEQLLSIAIQALQDSRHPTKVMVVDDDLNWLGTLPTLLKPWGLKVTTLADPQEFWTVLQMVDPDVLVLDVNMPEINGFELCQILRSDPRWQKVPVLFLSELTDASSQQKAFTVGGDDYLCKPLRGGELATRILHRLQRIQAYAG